MRYYSYITSNSLPKEANSLGTALTLRRGLSNL